MPRQGNHYKGNNGECFAAGCHFPAAITIVHTVAYDGEVWEHRADYCGSDAGWFYNKLTEADDTIDVWDLLIGPSSTKTN